MLSLLNHQTTRFEQLSDVRGGQNGENIEILPRKDLISQKGLKCLNARRNTWFCHRSARMSCQKTPQRGIHQHQHRHWENSQSKKAGCVCTSVQSRSCVLPCIIFSFPFNSELSAVHFGDYVCMLNAVTNGRSGITQWQTSFRWRTKYWEYDKMCTRCMENIRIMDVAQPSIITSETDLSAILLRRV